MTYPLGKLPPRADARTLRLADVLLDTTPPATWTLERAYPKLGARPVPMLANDRMGDCALVSAAHLTMGYEGAEHGRYTVVREDEIVRDYWTLTGGYDNGLYMLDVANWWRRTGIPTNGKRERIAAYGLVNPADQLSVKRACAGKLGLWVGLALPRTAWTQWENGKVWTVVGGGTGGDARPYSLGGHAVACLGYTPSCLYVGTWGKVQKMSWPFLSFYCDELYAVVDVLDKRADVVDVDAVRAFLADKAVVA